MPFDYEKIKDILACPQTHAPLVKDGDKLVSTDPESRFSYPIVDEIPRLLADEGTQLASDDWGEVMKRMGRDPGTGAETAAVAD